MTSEKIKILYVDDEENNLIAFRANFRKDYEVFTAISADEAFSLLKTNTANIIISDQRMPHTTGVEFLEETVRLYPDCIRLLITGQADIEVVIESINRGQVSKFIQKPWDWEKLSIAIDNCATLYKSRIEIKLKNKELQKINDELNKFVYSISHDLRSPLTSILGVVNLTKLIPELRAADSYFEMIEGRVEKLDGLIKKMIDYYKNARPDEEKDTIDFKSLILSIWDSQKNNNSLINFELAVNQETVFVGDRFRVEIIFENLISNAIKYQNPSAAQQSITVNVECNNQDAIIKISDNGIGISHEYLESVFNLFFRAEDTLNKEGAGIGLYIVKEAVEKMKGKIDMISSTMVGTKFEILIPNKNIL